MKKDQYSQTRGGRSRVLDISCEGCGEHVCYYQKDGPGQLRRMYFDRITGLDPGSELLACSHCGRDLGIKIVWAKEDRLAYRLFQDSVKKRVVKQKFLSENKKRS